MNTKKTEKLKVEFDEAVHGNTLRELVEEASDELLLIEAKRDIITDIKSRAKSELGVDTKLFNSLLRLHHKKIRETFQNENDEVIEVYDAVFDA